MTQEEFDALNGRVLALSMTMNSIIPSLSRVSAAQAALALKMAQLEMQSEDAESGSPAEENRARDAILDGYLGLLSAVAQNGQ